MLVLTRREDDWIEVVHRPTGATLKIAVFGIEGGQIKLGFDASYDEFRILRSEIADRGRRGGRSDA